MDSLVIKNMFKSIIPFLLLVLFVLNPSLAFCAGFQEEKLFDGDFYSSEELREKIESHKTEIQVLTNQIKNYEKEIDWLVLKINQIQDSGRKAGSNLKQSITSKEKKINTLSKTKDRLKYLVQYYTAQLDPKKEQTIKEILEERISAPKRKQSLIGQKKTKIEIKNIKSQKNVLKSEFKYIPSQGVTKLNDKDYITQPQLQTAINKAGLSDWIEITGTDNCLKIQTTLPILFPTGSAKVANEYKLFFQKLARFLKPYDIKVLVNGYADNVPIHNKKYPSNFELGATRAANIVHQLVNHGLKPSIFQIESTGKYRFASKGMSKQKTLERRAEVTIIFTG